MRQTSGLSKEVKMMIGIQNMSSDKLDTTKGQHQTTDLNGFQNKRAQRALGRSPEENVKGQGEAIILI